MLLLCVLLGWGVDWGLLPLLTQLCAQLYVIWGFDGVLQRTIRPLLHDPRTCLGHRLHWGSRTDLSCEGLPYLTAECVILWCCSRTKNDLFQSPRLFIMNGLTAIVNYSSKNSNKDFFLWIFWKFHRKTWDAFGSHKSCPHRSHNKSERRLFLMFRNPQDKKDRNHCMTSLFRIRYYRLPCADIWGHRYANAACCSRAANISYDVSANGSCKRIGANKMSFRLCNTNMHLCPADTVHSSVPKPP